MKRIAKYLLIALLALPLTVAANVGDGGDSQVFVLKAEKRFVGAKVEIFAANGNLITAQKVDKKKLVIDFGDVRKGVYTIRLTKGDERQEYTFEKR